MYASPIASLLSTATPPSSPLESSPTSSFSTSLMLLLVLPTMVGLEAIGLAMSLLPNSLTSISRSMPCSAVALIDVMLRTKLENRN
ncbi:hypothetical protein ES319_A11G139300v1 [Gossypium barbadense]|uniref:Uncharacterized protein n=2 Tax=Gossypium TaxID=3633 RepID=A0A5J5TMP7_GOSBA|nr:hypothetical protein ES319_A11G139300v1 [Gossypium barbadense]TYG93909.1 hypothetical protein ES288_A11G148600v1 [Gossypium darwinii]